MLTDLHWINDTPANDKNYLVRTRYRAPLVNGKVHISGSSAYITLEDDIRAITPGQSAVIYDAERVAGGGIVT